MLDFCKDFVQVLYFLFQTLIMDEARIRDLTSEFKFLTICGTVLLITFSHSGRELCSIAALKENLKNTTLTLMRALETNNTAELRSTLQGLGEKLKLDLQEAARQYGVGAKELSVSNLSNLFEEVLEEDHKIAELLSMVKLLFILTTLL